MDLPTLDRENQQTFNSQNFSAHHYVMDLPCRHQLNAPTFNSHAHINYFHTQHCTPLHILLSSIDVLLPHHICDCSQNFSAHQHAMDLTHLHQQNGANFTPALCASTVLCSAAMSNFINVLSKFYIVQEVDMINTGMADIKGNAIYAGDVLRSIYGYVVTVMRADDGSFYGKLVCDAQHPCKDIPYALNDGHDYVKVLQ